jgi:endoglucanase
MKVRFLFLCLAILIVQMGFLPCQSLKAQGFLHTRGEDIVDGSGNKVLLRGVGLGNWMLPEGYMWKFHDKGDRPRKIEQVVADLLGEADASLFWKEFRKNYITEADIQRIAGFGFNSVRPALNSRLFITEGDSAVFIEEGFLLLDNLISWCKKYGIYVIIDMHGAPGGQTGANIDDSADDLPRLFMEARNQDRLVRLWVKIAERYKNETTVAAYDLLNEPLPENTGSAEKYGNLLEPLYRRITSAIRESDKNHMITLEGMNWANNWSVFSAPFDSNVFYQFHYYCWNQPDNLNSIEYFSDMRKKLKTPVWIGETGEKNNSIYWATTQYFEYNNMGWSFWPWKKMDTRNTPYSINKPGNWDQVAAYTGEGPRPSSDIAKKAFNELLENIKLVNCVYYPDVVNSIFRQLPVKVQAENYGHRGSGLSYFVKDTIARAESYRVKEPVPIFNFIPDGSKNSEQYIRLTEKEWTVYEVNSPIEQTIRGLMRVKSADRPTNLLLLLNGSEQNIRVTGNNWQDSPVEGLKFHKGVNLLKVIVLNGNADIDWIDLK